MLPTIRSRTQHFEFHLLEAEELADHVRYVIADAGLGLGDDAVDHVVRQGGGSARDTLSALDQVAAMGGVVEQAQPVEAILDALCAHDAGAALVAVAEATAAGRDARTLGEVLIGRLRDAFLAVMKAPDRHLPAADLVRAEALGGALGAAGLTRALEVLGDALVELAKKPDPRIVLEVALVRICRPEADRSFDAILERLERLERGVVSSPPLSSPAVAPADPAGSGDADAPARRGGPADAAREELAKVRTPRAPVKKATSTPKAAPPRPAARAQAAPPAAEPAAAPAGDGPGAADLQAAWPAVLDGMKAVAKGMFRDGRFDVDATSAVLTVPKGPPVQLLEARRPELEQALAAHFGRPVPVRIVVDAVAAAPPAAVPDEEEPIDVHELEDAPAAGSGVERLAEAFPGAELVDE